MFNMETMPRMWLHYERKRKTRLEHLEMQLWFRDSLHEHLHIDKPTAFMFIMYRERMIGRQPIRDLICWIMYTVLQGDEIDWELVMEELYTPRKKLDKLQTKGWELKFDKYLVDVKGYKSHELAQHDNEVKRRPKGTIDTGVSEHEDQDNTDEDVIGESEGEECPWEERSLLLDMEGPQARDGLITLQPGDDRDVSGEEDDS